MARNRTTLIAGIATAALAGAIGITAGSSDVLPHADAAGEFTVSPAQLGINQRISQAAVKRANANRKSLTALKSQLGVGGAAAGQQAGPAGPQGPQGPAGPTLPLPSESVDGDAIKDASVGTADLADESVTGPKLAELVRERIPRWANVDGLGAVTLEAGAGVIGVQREGAVGAGRYRVTLDRPVTEQTCSVSVSVRNSSTSFGVHAQHSYINGQIRVQIINESGNASDQDFSLQASC